MIWTVLVRSLIVSDLGVFSWFITRSHKSLPSLWFSAESHRCCILHKDSAVKNVKYHRSAQWVKQKCPRFGPAPTMDQGSFCTSPGSALCTGSLRKGWAIFPRKASPPLTVPGSNKQRGLVLCLDFVSHYPTLHSEQMWGSFSLFGTLLHPD